MEVKRPVRIVGELVFVPLTQGYEAVVDLCDIDVVSGYNWQANKSTKNVVYASRHTNVNGKHITAFMHRDILKPAHGLVVDHIDGDTLNNRRSNLRSATFAQNSSNSGKRPTNTSGYKGIFWREEIKKWCALIKSNGKTKYLGSYETKEEAHEAYCRAAIDIHGEFANFGREDGNRYARSPMLMERK